MVAISKISKYLDKFILKSDKERSLEIIPEKMISMLMTSLMTSQHDVKFGLCSRLNDVVTISAI